MPTYEYRCTQCGHEFEHFQKMNDEPLGECPDCTGDVQRLISSGGGLLFKGTGFYATDYRSGSPPDAGAPSDSGGGENKSETKSAAKSTESSEGASSSGSKDE